MTTPEPIITEPEFHRIEIRGHLVDMREQTFGDAGFICACHGGGPLADEDEPVFTAWLADVIRTYAKAGRPVLISTNYKGHTTVIEVSSRTSWTPQSWRLRPSQPMTAPVVCPNPNPITEPEPA